MAGPTTQNPYAPAHLNPAAGGVGHIHMARNRSPQSGGDIGGPKKLPYNFRDGALHNYGMTRMAKAAEQSHRAPNLPKHEAFHNAEKLGHARNLGKPQVYGSHPRGNSEGKAEMLMDYHDGHITDTVSRFAKNRLSKGFTANHESTHSHRKAQGDEWAGQPFRRSSGAFGPQRKDRATGKLKGAHDHNEGQGAPGRRLEGGPRSKVRSTV